MILQALTRHYETLVRAGTLQGPGWGPVKVSYALSIGGNGELEQVISMKTEQPRGKKTVLAPQERTLPAQVKRTAGVAANFLCDNSGYILGVDNKGKPQRTTECFAACRALHEEILKEADSPATRAGLAFFRSWEPARAGEHPALADVLEDVMAGANLIFRHGGCFVDEDPTVKRAWERYYSSGEEDIQGLCLVTGETNPIVAVHPAIKNVAGASSGAALVAFNAPAFCSYGKEQSHNAPTGKYAAFAYTSALNHLLAQRDRVYRVGDATVVFWAENGADCYSAFFGGLAFGGEMPYNEGEVRDMVKALCDGRPVSFREELLDPDMEFYVLGLSPNAARLSVRFFLRNTFGDFLRNVQAHHDRLEIVRPTDDKFETLPVWKLLSETVNQNARDKSPAADMAGETVRAILSNTRYPATLLNGVVLRVRAEREITRGRAAILKAYYMKLAELTGREDPDIPKEVLQVSLNPDAANVPYILGRLFSVLEAIQSAANPGINTTIKDRYFNGAMSTPGIVFPTLINLAQKHLKKLRTENKWKKANDYNKQLTELMSKLGTEYPVRLNLAQQGSFQLGYYHQTQAHD